jgi:hypothetical protein
MIPTLIDLSLPIHGAPHFSYWELTRTEHRDYQDENRRVPKVLAPASEELAQTMEVVRSWWGKPVFTHSAYRCPPLNRSIGGSRTSQHMSFQAIDFHVSGLSLQTVFTRIASSDIPFGQLLLEGPDPSKGLASWIHLSLGEPWRPRERCREVLYFSTRTGKYTQP